MKKISQVFVGVDVSKKRLDIHVRPVGKAFSFANSPEGVEQFARMLSGYPVEQIVCEASGGYEASMIRLLQQKGFKVWRVEPRRIKGFIRSEGVYAKTDKIDAKMIAQFAEEKKCKHEPTPLTEVVSHLQALVNRRGDLLNFLSAEKTRLQQISDSFCIQSIETTIILLEHAIEQVDSEIKKTIDSDNDLSKKAAILASIPGIGQVTTAVLLADLPELGSATHKEIAALVGVAPYIRQSGPNRGSGWIGGGRTLVRKTIYMAALSATRCNSTVKKFYDRLRLAGKKPKVALVAVMRKMIIIINAMISKGESWQVI